MDKTILQNPGIEITTKYLYLFFKAFTAEIKETKGLVLQTEKLLYWTGLTLGRFYRARNELVMLGVLIHEKEYCSKTKRKVRDIYEVM